MEDLENWLRKKGVWFRIIQKPATVHTADAAASAGIDLARVTKSLIFLTPEDKPILAIIPGDCKVDIKKIKSALAIKDLALVPFDQAQKYSGYEPGATPPVICDKIIPVVIDKQLAALESVFGGGGSRDKLIELKVKDIIKINKAQIADIIMDKSYISHNNKLSNMAKPDKIKLTFPDGSIKEYKKGITGLEITKEISQKLLKEALAILVNGKIQDLSDTINFDATIKILKFSDAEGKMAYWHSSSHILADAVKRIWPDTKLGIGPAIEEGFYYDFDKKEPFTENDLPRIEEQMKKIIKDDLKYEHVFVPLAEAQKLLANEPFKLDILKYDVKEKHVSFHKHGNFYDLCNNPVVQSTGQIGAVKLLSIAGAYWRGDPNRGQLQRIYGISFPTQKELDEFLKLQAELEKRDHRKIGKALKLFHFAEEVGPGLPLWMPNGEAIRNELMNFMRDVEIKHGYKYVSTPHITKSALYFASGHLPYYKDDMYPPMKLDNEEYYLRPMNCPHHHMIYKQLVTSYRDLPLRLAEPGTLYRKEASGAAYGLMRVRGMTQNDSHNYCTKAQAKDEIIRVINLFKEVYGVMGIKNFWFRLSLPDFKMKEKFGGDAKEWEWAAQQIRDACRQAKIELKEVAGEAAFYGPKIDVQIKNVLGREESIATCQLDVMVAKRMKLEFVNEKNEIENPIIIHRAILGSYERFVAFLIENYAGNFPLWLSPVQVKILSFTDRNIPACKKIEKELFDAGLRVESDYGNNTVDYKVRAAELEKIPYILVIGDKEEQNGTVAVRKRGAGKVQFGVKASEFVRRVKEEIEKKV